MLTVLKMFSNDLVIPKNFISLENYKTKTNPQTTKFCDQLSIDDPLALVLGQWTRSSLSQNDQEMDSTFSSFINSTVCSYDEEDCIEEMSKQLPMSPFVLPEPKNDTNYTNNDDSLLNNSLLVSNMSSEEPNTKSNQSQGKFIKR
jgi:hypothetical protein